MLYLEHSVESLARGGPWQLGKIVPGRSAWRPLREAETEEYGGSSRRVLYGCVVTMIRSNSDCSRVLADGNMAFIDDLPSFALSKDVLSSQLPLGSTRTDKNWHFGSMGSFNIASSTQCSTFKQLFLTWSRV